MAFLALGLVGAGIGSAIGGTFLGVSAASLGWTIGSFLGNQLFPEKTKVPTLYGPRLNDLTIQSSAYGNMVPMIFGRAKVTGNLIWSTGRIEHTRTTTIEAGGGKGFGGGGSSSQEQVEYYYTASFAIALNDGMAVGPIIGIRRIWANGEIVYDMSDTGVSTIGSGGLVLTVYPGDEDQLPDPVIESFKGAGNVPAYRGTAYVVFNDTELVQKWGQNVPNLEFEVLRAGTEVGMRSQAIYTLPESGFLEFVEGGGISD